MTGQQLLIISTRAHFERGIEKQKQKRIAMAVSEAADEYLKDGWKERMWNIIEPKI